MADDDRSTGPRPAEGAAATARLLEELLEQGTPVAEIAVRLGISVPDAHARIGMLGRATPVAAPETPDADDATALPPVAARPVARDADWSRSSDADAERERQPRRSATPAAPQPRPATPAQRPPRRGLSRRSLLALGAAGVAGLATGGAFLATRGGESSQGVARPAREIPVPPTLTPVPPPLSVLRPASGVFTELTPDPGAPLEEEHGIFFMRTRGADAGSVTGWQLTEVEGNEAPAYRVSEGGRFVAAQGAMHDRVSGRSWVWPKDKLRLVGFSDDAALFRKVDGEENEMLVQQGRYLLTDASLELRAEFDLQGSRLPSAPPIFQPGGRRVFLALQQAQQYPALFMLDGETAQAQIVFGPQRPTPLQRILFHEASRSSDGESFFMPYSFWPTRPPRTPGYGTFVSFLARLGWEGEHRKITRVRVDLMFPSPDGALVAGERILPIPGVHPEAFEEPSSVLVIDGETGRTRFRIRSARLNYGDTLGGARWLADSSGLIVQSRIGGKVGYSLVSADGLQVEPLPDPPRASTHWFEHPDRRGAVPSPDDPALISFGRTDLYDREQERWLGMDVGAAAPAHLDPWPQTASDEVVLTLPHEPHRLYPLLAGLDETTIEIVGAREDA